MTLLTPRAKVTLAALSVLTSLGAMSTTGTAVAKRTTVTFMTASFIDDKIWAALKDAFEKRYPALSVRYIPGGGGDLSKLLTLMAGGVGPDVSFFDQNISAYALKNLVVPLDSFIKKDGILATDFWKPSWRECQWNGKTYALGWGTDANFACLYNKRLFREAGLNPEAPVTVSELDAISPKLTSRDATGLLKTASIIPWSVYGYGNSAYTWGWIFGGDFYDEAARKVTCAEPRVVASFKWMSEFLAKYGGMSKFSYVSKDQWLKGSGCYQFFQGRTAMAYAHPGETPLLRQFGSTLDIGIGKMPVAEGVTDAPAWLGGWKIGLVPSKSANRDAAWTWLKYITADPEGTAIICGGGTFPAYKKSNLYPEYRRDPLHAGFINVLESASHVRPIMPASDVLYAQLDNALTQVLAGKKSPIDALTLAQAETQRQLQRYVTRYKF